MLKRSIAGLLSLCFLSNTAFAVPVVDDAVALKQLSQLVDQTKNMHDQLKAVVDLKDKASKTVAGINHQIEELQKTQKLLGDGHYQYGTKFDNPSLKKLRYAGKDFDGFLNAYKGNSSVLEKIAKRLSRDFEVTESNAIFSKNASKSQMKLYDAAAKTAIAAGAQSEMSYGSANNVHKILDALQADIDKADNQKALLELIARIEIEHARISTMRIKNDAANLKINSLNMQQTVSDAKWASEFLKWKQ